MRCKIMAAILADRPDFHTSAVTPLALWAEKILCATPILTPALTTRAAQPCSSLPAVQWR